MKFILNLILTTVIYLCEGKEAPKLQKCCPSEQTLLLADLNGCQDTNISQTYGSDTYPWWLPDNMTFLDSVTFESKAYLDLPVAYGKKQPCSGNDMEIVPIHEDVAILSDSSLRILLGKGNFTFPSDSFCIDTVHIGDFLSHVVLLCPCKHHACLRKCCHDGRILKIVNGSYKCMIDDFAEWSPKIQTDVLPFIIHGHPKCEPDKSMSLLNNFAENKFVDHWFQSDGTVFTKDSTFNNDEYCGDIIGINDEYSHNLLVCHLDNYSKKTINVFYGILFTFGSVFLAITLVVLLILPEMRKSAHSKSLIAHLAVTLVGYLFLAANTFGNPQTNNKGQCILIASCIQFSFLASFFWLNVICIDISWTFSGLRAPKGNSLIESDKKKFFYYSLYVWGSTIFITGITVAIDLIPSIDKSFYKPNFGVTKCWFTDKEPIILYFYLPIGVLLGTNLILFIYTSYKIIKLRRETALLLRSNSCAHEGNRPRRTDEYRFLMYLKLFSLMGITWLFEIISWVSDNERSYWLWYVTDAMNASRGVFIFVIFCCKQKVLKLLKTRVDSLFNVNTTNKHKIKVHDSKLRSSTLSSTVPHTHHMEMENITHS